MKTAALITGAALLLSGTAAAQTGVQVWGGLGPDAYIMPTASLGLSADVARFGGLTASVRGGASLSVLLLVPDATGPVPTYSAELLLRGNEPGMNLYGGPSVGNIAGLAWILGGVAGVQGPLGQGNWGYFGELKARYLLGVDQPVLLPGVNLGVTYRF
ncbi:hypothetical protein [Deinococcus sp. JMULE3]|uniref:hypothetical protein n=1 Tax=Deinococcus sp. JMULE3 TaxID=2518341 RepID=UPI0015756190|nr:hypothetical protein [Deinococcus sp. JMULE3]NTX99672.1 hypothetical protein [Deinococcus sp. JMULE3]